MPDVTASTVAISFMNAWISRFGVPLYVVTDRGTQFESELFQELSSLTGFHRLRTTAYHPQANGIIERQHRILKTAIIARKQNWLDALPIVLLGLRSTPTEHGFAPSVAVTGSSLLLPKPMIVSEEGSTFTSDRVQKLAQEMSLIDVQRDEGGILHSVPKAYIPKDLQTCSHVWLRIDRVRRPLEAPYTGPFKVLQRHTKFFTIELVSGKEQNVSIDRLKPALLPVPSTEINLPQDHQQGTPEEVQDESFTTLCEDNPSPTNLDSNISRKTRSGRIVKFGAKDDFYYY